MIDIHINMVQAVALAVCTYGCGVWCKNKCKLLDTLSIPSPVVGGMTFALLASILQGAGVLKLTFDSTLQTVLMLAFFTTIGLMASVKVVRRGGWLLLGFLSAVVVLAVLQNVLGMSLAAMMGLDKHYGILTGSISMMGGLGTAAAFGPYFEQTYGITGATAVAVTSATFGMIAALMIGGPFGEWLIHHYHVKTPKGVQIPNPPLRVPNDMEADVTSEHTADQPAFTREVMKAVSIVAICMALGMIVSDQLGKFITLPAYLGSMMVAAVLRNTADLSGKFTVEGRGLNAVADISLVLFVTMAINSLKLHELIHLALPMAVILAAQTILMLIFAWAILFMLFGRSYDAVMLCAGGIGFSMGATANGLANMQAIAEKWGSSPRAWLIVSLVGAFLIDLFNALLITWMAAL